MAEIKILIEGYAKQLEKGWLASSTCCLIKSDDKRIITDPGCNRKKLLDALRREGLTTNDIDYVLPTHNHLDHSLLSGIFENAKIVSAEGQTYDNDLMLGHSNKVADTEIEILSTPGHANEHQSFVVPTERGRYIIAGDVFWWADKEKQIIDTNKDDLSHPAELNKENLIASRKRLLATGKYIIPGHGKMFEVKR